MSKSNFENNITKIFGRSLNGWAISKAILEDYSEVVAKIENKPVKEIYDRVSKKADKLFSEAKSEFINDQK